MTTIGSKDTAYNNGREAGYKAALARSTVGEAEIEAKVLKCWVAVTGGHYGNLLPTSAGFLSKTIADLQLRAPRLERVKPLVEAASAMDVFLSCNHTGWIGTENLVHGPGARKLMELALGIGKALAALGAEVK